MPFRDTAISPATDVCPHVAEYSAKAFDCTLRGPFADRCRTRLSAARALCDVLGRLYLRFNGFLVPILAPFHTKCQYFF